ncbi:MAG: hypothetical protein ABI678_04500 [Kofleriaceae bacterium]
MPADQGLSALGMLMQLAGSVLAAYVALFAFILLFSLSGRGGSGGSETLFMFLILGLCIGRSLMHRSAGAQLLYGDPNIQGGRMRGVQRYITFALAQSAILGLLFKFKFEMPGKVAFAIAVGLALWPGLLAGLLALPRFRRFKDELPITEDKGFEGASILMAVLGLCGLIGVVAALVLVFKMPGKELTRGMNILLPLSLILLVVRSVLHVQAGLSGLRETSVDKSVELANRYANFGVISSFCVAGALLLFIMSQAMSVAGLAIVSGIAWMLLAWPLIVRRFFSDRQFADLLAGDQAPVHRRSPDAGLTWLGWLLVAYATMTASFVIPQLILGVDGNMMGGGRHHGGGMDPSEMMGIFAAGGMRSIWWSVGLLALQGWAGFELIRMSAHSRMIATIFGVAGIAITAYINWPMMQMLRHGGMGAMEVVALAPLALALVIPVATLLLVNRKIAPVAQARFRGNP